VNPEKKAPPGSGGANVLTQLLISQDLLRELAPYTTLITRPVAVASKGPSLHHSG